MVEFTFGQVEAVLSAVNNIADDKRVAFTGRLKFLQKNGVPMRSSTGRGKAGSFSFDHLLQVAVAVELLQAGLTPQRAAALVRQNWWMKAEEIYSILEDLDYRPTDFLDYAHSEASGSRKANVKFPTAIADWVWLVYLSELMDLSGSSDYPTMRAIQAVSHATLSDWSEGGGISRAFGMRCLVINAAALFSHVAYAVVIRFHYWTLPELLNDLEEAEIDLAESARLFREAIRVGQNEFVITGKMRKNIIKRAAFYSSSMPMPETRNLVRMVQCGLSQETNTFWHLIVAFSDLAENRLDARELPIEAIINSVRELVVFGILKETEDANVFHWTPFGRRYAQMVDIDGERNVDPEA